MNNSRLKSFLLWCLSHPYASRPRWWVRTLINPFRVKRGCGSIIRLSVRMDIFPWHGCSIGRRTIIESRATLNNGMGDIQIGDNCRIGIGTTVISPVTIGNNVHTAQNVVISGLNHSFADTTRTIDSQGVNVSTIVIENDVWIGANAVITSGVRIGEHSIVGAGSVVTHDVEPRTVVGGVPAKVIKKID